MTAKSLVCVTVCCFLSNCIYCHFYFVFLVCVWKLMIAVFKVPEWLWHQRLDLRWLCGETLGIVLFQVSCKILKGIKAFCIYDLFIASLNRAKQKTSTWISLTCTICVHPPFSRCPTSCMSNSQVTYFQVIVLKNVLCCSLGAKLCQALLWPRGLQPTKHLYPCDFRGKSTGAGCHFLLHPKLYLWTCNSYDWKQSLKNFVQAN